MEKNANLVEWDYGEYEGRLSVEILLECPTWDLFRDGCPGGESIEQIGRRADAVVTMLRGIEGNVLVFSSGHFLRVLAARWLGFEPAVARYFVLGTASLCILGYEHTRQRPAIRLWNESHVSDK
jgi:probable phosphoglycerate mutase